MKECDQESKEMWEALRKPVNIGSLGPMPEADGECCRRHLEIVGHMSQIPGGLEHSKKFKFCPECGRRLL